MKKRYMNGLVPIPDSKKDKLNSDGSKLCTGFVEMTNADYDSDKSKSAKYFTYDEDGNARLKTDEEIQADQDLSDKITKEREATIAKDEALNNLAVDVNGLSVQTRPKDELNIRLAVSALDDGQVIDWRLSDNSVGSISKEDLMAAYELGIGAGLQINAEWTATLRSL